MSEQFHRRRLIFIPHRYVLSVFSRGLLQNQFVHVPEPIGLPQTARGVGVWFDYARDSFAMVVEDASFEPVTVGQQFPEIKVEWTTVEVEIKGIS